MEKRFAFAAAGLGAALAGISVGAFLLLGSPGDEPPTTTTRAAVTTAATTTTGPVTSAVTTTSAATTTLPPAVTITLDLQGEEPLQQAARAFYAWLGNRSGVEPPPLAAGLAAFLDPVAVTADLALTGESAEATLAGGAAVAVVTAGEDALLAVDEGSGWQIVGAKLPSLGLGAWYGEAVRFVMVIGTDARPGQNEPYYRGDSLHLLSSNVAERAGSIVGFPRDSWVAAPYGNDKLTHVNARAGSAAVVQIARDLTGLPIEGYLVTGFLSFRRLVDVFGGVEVEVPFAMNDPKSSAFLNAGLQLLLGQDALAFSRNRHISGADFTRSFHQGVVIAAGLAGVQQRGILDLPELLALLSEYTWTDLTPGDLLTLAAGAYEMDPVAVTNLVLPGTIGTAGAASVVYLAPEAEDVYADLADGIIAPAE